MKQLELENETIATRFRVLCSLCLGLCYFKCFVFRATVRQIVTNELPCNSEMKQPENLLCFSASVMLFLVFCLHVAKQTVNKMTKMDDFKESLSQKNYDVFGRVFLNIRDLQ